MLGIISLAIAQLPPNEEFLHPMPSEVLHRAQQQAGVVAKEPKSGIAATTKTASLTISFVAVIKGKGLAASQLRFVCFKLTANVATQGAAGRPSDSCPFDRGAQPIPAAVCVAVEARGLRFVPPSATASTLQDGVGAVSKLNQIAFAVGATIIRPTH
jgi:hypothetical protein